VAASPDAAAWRVVADGLPIYRSRETGLNGSTRVRYPETRDRWLRVRVSGETPLVIAGARVCHRPERPTDRIVVAAGGAEAPVEDSISAWRLDAGGPTPVSAVRVETSSPRFHRPLEVRASDDGEAWRRIGDGQIYRYPDGEPPVLRERLLVEFPSARGRFFEVRIHDGDDPALAELGVEVHSHRRHVVFPRRSGRSYRLVYGNPRAPAPEYDLGRTVRTADLTAAAPAAVGPELRNPGYRSGEPWSERHPWVLWSALGLAAGALAWAAWRVMR
ncbi:MAG: DUF3999 family protein, partial [Thermoanaerobaculia bacterium]|nr:DUF3999 family protein [Thermoanaerobaculia bacterium]